MTINESTARPRLVRLIDHRVSDRCGIYRSEKDWDDPYLCIGQLVPDETLHRVAGKYGFSFSELQAFRDEQNEEASHG